MVAIGFQLHIVVCLDIDYRLEVIEYLLVDHGLLLD